MREPNSSPISGLLSEADLAEIEKRAAAATPGPWVEGYVTGRCHLDHEHTRGECRYDYRLETSARGQIASLALTRDVLTTTKYGLPSAADVAFIAAARTDVPALAAHVRVLERSRDGWRADAEREAGHAAYWRERMAAMVGAVRAAMRCTCGEPVCEAVEDVQLLLALREDALHA